MTDTRESGAIDPRDTGGKKTGQIIPGPLPLAANEESETR